MSGPRYSASCAPLSGDWLTIRRNGVAILDVRTTIETYDEALIYVTYSGTSDRGEDGYEKVLQAIPVARPIPIRISLRFQNSPQITSGSLSPLPRGRSSVPRARRSRLRRLRGALKSAPMGRIDELR